MLEMQFILSSLLVSVAIASPRSSSASQCDALGITDKTNIPAGVDGSLMNTSINHSPRGLQESLIKRECWNGSPTGYVCANGYCKSKCGDSGKWCWLARDLGRGAWFTCTQNEHCVPTNLPHNAGCGKEYN